MTKAITSQRIFRDVIGQPKPRTNFVIARSVRAVWRPATGDVISPACLLSTLTNSFTKEIKGIAEIISAY